VSIKVVNIEAVPCLNMYLCLIRAPKYRQILSHACPADCARLAFAYVNNGSLTAHLKRLFSVKRVRVGVDKLEKFSVRSIHRFSCMEEEGMYATSEKVTSGLCVHQFGP
jgi:hypothetical protein